VHSLAELGVPSPAETGTSFLENALLKARHAAAMGGCAALADDSGLEVDALGGAPGIHSARYAGNANNTSDPAKTPDTANTSDTANNLKLIAALAKIRADQRSARFRCVLVYLDHAEDPEPVIAEGRWEGRILDTPRGHGGFGYDPYFWILERQVTAAELTMEEKNRLSHRGAAMHTLRQSLELRFGLAASGR
jgi:XTP/dITP diphosphohydrolase